MAQERAEVKLTWLLLGDHTILMSPEEAIWALEHVQHDHQLKLSILRALIRWGVASETERNREIEERPPV